MSILLFILGIVLFSSLIIAHELGHFIMARRNGVQVEEFGFFFPPRLWSKKTPSGLTISINAIPFGGFVRLKGEHDADKGEGSFGEATLWAKTKILLAGVAMNLVAAFVILTILAVVGMPQLINNQYTVRSNTKIVPQKVSVLSVESNSPAASIGLKTNDVLTSIGPVNGPIRQINNADNLPNITKSLAGRKVEVTFLNVSGKPETKTVQLRSSQVVAASQSTKNPIGYLGVATTASSQFVLQRSTWSAPVVAVGLIRQMTTLTFRGLGHVVSTLFKGHPSQASKQITGPVGLVVILKNSASLGYQFVLFVIALVSLSLALFNVLPIPALDGGRLFFSLVPRLLTKRPLKPHTEEWVHGGGLIVLFLLLILITFSDITHIHG